MLKDLFYRGRLLCCALATALGGVVGSESLSLFWLLAPLVTAAAAIWYLSRKDLRIWLAIACAAFFYAGMFAGHARASSWSGRGGPAGEVVLWGEIEVGCRGEQGDVVDLFQVTDIERGRAVKRGDLFLLRAQERASADYRWGDQVKVTGNLYVFERESGGVGGSLIAEQVEVVGRTANPLLRLAVAYRELLRRQVEGLLPPDAAGLIEGVVLGDYRLLKASDLKYFRLAGLIHLCAASGLNVGILAAFILALGRMMRLPRRLVAVLEIPLLFSYALAVGLSVPIKIATMVAVLAAAAFLTGRDFDYLPALGLAVFYLVARDPAAARGVSFQLCLAAAMGMVTLQGPLNAQLGGGDSKVRALIATTLAAQLTVAPVLLFHFGEVSVLAVVSNLLVLPLVPALMALSMLSPLLGALGLPFAATLLRASGILSKWVIFVARAVSAPPWAAMRICPLSPLLMAAYYWSLAAAFVVAGKLRRPGRAVLLLLVVAALVWGCLLPSARSGGAGGMQVVFIDVGQGDSTLIRTPSGATVLVDGGIDERVLEDDLRGRGLRYIDAVIVSHPDADHIGGLKGAFDTCAIGMLVHPATGTAGQYSDLLGRAEDAGTPVRVMRAGDRLCLGELELRALSPPRDMPEGLSTNEASLVLRAQAPGLSLLLTGDVEEEGEAILMGGGESLRCDLLKVPHHGGCAEDGDRLFSRVEPKIAVISVGEGNRFGHPSQATVDSLRRAGAAVYRTDLCGDIVIDVVNGGYRVKCER